MDTSIFMDKAKVPSTVDLKTGIGELHTLWMELRDYTFLKYRDAKEEWNFPGKKYGWSFRIKDKKCAIIYLLPRDNYFKVAFVFGQKATTSILASDISEEIKTALSNAKVYAEGRGIRIDIRTSAILEDIKKLIDI